MQSLMGLCAMETSAIALAETMPGVAQPEPMDDGELVSILGQYEVTSIGYHGADNEITAAQEETLNYYNGFMDDLPAQDGQSGVIDHTVALVVDNALSAILEPFVSSDETVRFMPRTQEDIEAADQATDYVNYVFNNDNPGFLILHNWFKDALLSKLGVVKVWWQEDNRFEGQRVMLDPANADIVRNSPGYAGEQDGVAYIGQYVPDGRVRVECVPPEEFRIAAGARDIEDSPYTAHVPTNYTRSDLLEMGFDPEIIEGLPAHPYTGEDNTLRDARYEDENYHDARIDSPHKPNDRIAVRDEYVKLDYDGDGVAELRRIIRVDTTILLNEEVDENPFATLCPIPMPHKIFGHSLGDRARQEQKIGTVLWRQTLDNLYKSNNPRPIIGEGALLDDGSTEDSLEDNAPGAAIHVRDLGQFQLSDAVRFTADKSFPMMELLDKKVEENTGISLAGQGLDTNALRKSGQMTATEMAMISEGKNARTKMIARIFAETGVSRVFRLIFNLVVANQPRERIVRLRNKYVPVDPRNWPEMDVSISVGLGIGDKGEQIGQASTVLETMERLGDTPFASLIDADKVYNGVKRLFTAAGVKNTDDYLNNPAESPPAAPGPSEAELAMQAQMAESQQKIALQREEMMAKARIKMFEAELDFALSRATNAQEAQLAYDKLLMEYDLKRETVRMDRDAKVQMSGFRPGGDLDK